MTGKHGVASLLVSVSPNVQQLSSTGLQGLRPGGEAPIQLKIKI